MFKNARDFNIGKIEVFNDSSQNVEALKDLCSNSALGALLYSKERFDAPKCHPGTRVAVQKEISGWVRDDGRRDTAQPRKMLLLTGPAGSGKTTIMNTIGEQLQNDKRLAAAFFFSSFDSSLERSTKGRFITTLAYQLIQHECFRDVREHVLSSIARDPAILSMHLRMQLEVLILEPLRNWRPVPGNAFPSPEIILVDGLDGCGQTSSASCDQAERNASRVSREQDQTEILQVLLDALKDPSFPFRLIISSRPEPAIQHFFSTSAKDHTVEIFLDDKYNPDADIKLYLTSHFSRIQCKHTHLPPSWPGDDAIATLVDNASGQMIYAATIIRFVETPSNPPAVQLQIILESGFRSGSGPSNPFGPLDTLYAHILNSSPDRMLVLKWLKAYHRLKAELEGPFATWAFTLLCESSSGEVEHLFASMAALVRVEDRRGYCDVNFIFYHKSFKDFLDDALRYGAFFAMDEEEVEKWILGRLVTALERKGPAVPLNPVDSSFFCREVVGLWGILTSGRRSLTEWYDERLLGCDADWWLSSCSSSRALLRGDVFISIMFVVAHNKCLPFLPCRRECRRRRKPILAAWKRVQQTTEYKVAGVESFAILLDKFRIKRILPHFIYLSRSSTERT